MRYLIVWAISYYIRRHKANWHLGVGEVTSANMEAALRASLRAFFLLYFHGFVLDVGASVRCVGGGRQGSRERRI